MSVCSMNIRGLGWAVRARALSDLLATACPGIFLLQETMCEDMVAISKITGLLRGWEVSAVSSNGMSGGLLVAWDPRFYSFVVFKTVWGILMEGRRRADDLSLFVLNCYAPYRDREIFWNGFQSSRLLSRDDIIVAGDLNFTRLSQEIWGPTARMDVLADYFSELLLNNDLIDIYTGVITPT